eukprot:CFRG2191T1
MEDSYVAPSVVSSVKPDSQVTDETRKEASSATEVQQKRADLRERALEAILLLTGRRADINMFGGEILCGVFEGMDSQQTTVLVAKLETQIGVYSHVQLRATDVISLNMDI